MSDNEPKVESKQPEEEKINKKTKKPRKCCVCKKRTLMNMKCKCKSWTCIAHMNKHDCTYNWQEHCKKKLDDNLVKVEFSKVTTI